MNNEKDQDFRQLEGAFDFPMQPDADFTARLANRLAQEKPADVNHRSTVIASPSRGNSNVQAPRRSHPLFVAAAVLLVFALAAATIFQLAPRALEQQHAGPPLVTMPENAVATPGEDQLLNTTRLPGIGAFDIEVVEGNLLYGNAFSPEDRTATPGFIAYDLETLQIRWQLEAMPLSQVLMYGDRMIGTRAGTSDTTQWVHGIQPREIVALNAETGEILWEKEFPQEHDGTHWGGMLIIDDVLIHTGAFSTIGYDAETGDQIWETELEPILLPNQGSHYHISRPLEWNQNLVLIDGNFHGRVMNPATGDVLSEFDIPLTMSELMASNFEYWANGDHVVVAAYRYTNAGPEITVIEVNPTTGEIVREQSMRDMQISTSVYGNGTIAVMVSEWESSPWFMQLFGQSGYSRMGMIWIDLGSQQEILRTELVRSDVIYAGSVINTGEFMCYMADEYTCFDRTGTRYLTGITEPVRGAQQIGDSVYLSTENGVIRVELP